MGLRVEDIRKPKGVKRNVKRKGRGIGSGRGKTSGRGHKGAKSRSGGGTYNPGFEGGQMPLIRRLPKRGFTNKWRREWDIVNIGTLQKTDSINDGAVIDKEFLLANRILRKKNLPFKVLGKGNLEKSLTVKADAFSDSAKEQIEKAGGKVEVVKFVRQGAKKIEDKA
ncbi:MAG: 50S ribosomal protein L15 [Candidatus Omnitrophica bacterium]|nr:50S ribosomal protein L15 [Candidatus Omnitrophota bacterium]